MAQTSYGYRPTNAYRNTDTRQNVRGQVRPIAQSPARFAVQQSPARLAVQQSSARLAAQQSSARIAAQQSAARSVAQQSPTRSVAQQSSARSVAQQSSVRSVAQQSSGRRTGSYVYGNAAPKLDVQQEMERQPRRTLSNATRKNRDKARHMSLGYVLFLVLAMCVAGYVLIHYIQLQADITTATERIASQEKELNNLKVANDEELSRITSSVDMEEVKRVAIGELGMIYPQEGQIITYTNEAKDYVRKVEGSN